MALLTMMMANTVPTTEAYLRRSCAHRRLPSAHARASVVAPITTPVSYDTINQASCDPALLVGPAASGGGGTHCDDDDGANLLTRSNFFTASVALVGATGLLALTAAPELAMAFEGGIGGLGKTKPNTGVVLWDPESSAPLQNSAGLVTAELNVAGQPVLTSFQTPWPLLPTTAGLEARDLQNSESAFVQVIEQSSSSPTTKSGMLQLLLGSVLSQQGKFGAYGAPIDVKVKQLVVSEDKRIVTCAVPFTTFTPGLRESERQLLIKAVNLSKQNWILLVVGTTRQRFAVQQVTLQKVVDSFEAIPAPTSNRSR